MTERETEIIFLLDRSGSMHICEDDAIGGYNSFLDRQRLEGGRAYVTTVLFDNHYDVLCEHEDIHGTFRLTGREYFARGSTALLDAIGMTISRAAKRQSEQGGAAKTLMVIITDGLDNMSRVYSIKTIHEMIHEREEHGWEFIFLGADMESLRTAQSIGIPNERSGQFTKTDIRQKFEGLSGTVSHFRTSGEVNQDWQV